ncbi:MAG: hypothetical protein ACRCSO_01115 [Sphingomonas sp.]
MSTPDAFSQLNSPRDCRGVVVDRPGMVPSIGSMLNHAFGEQDGVPDEIAMLLHRLDEADHPVAR